MKGMITDEEFVALLNSIDMPDAELATHLMVSRPTITRWRAGKNLAHRFMRDSVARFIVSENLKRMTGHNGMTADCKSAASGTVGSIPTSSTNIAPVA
jgi:hypothetical protein